MIEEVDFFLRKMKRNGMNTSKSYIFYANTFHIFLFPFLGSPTIMPIIMILI